MSVLKKFLAASVLLSCATALPGAAIAEKFSTEGKAVLIAASAAPFSAGTLNRQENIPASYGPFKARSAGIGVYRGRMNVAQSDLSDHIFVVIRTQSDKNHRFGWIRAFVNNKLIATEASIRDNKIIQDVTKELKAGDVQLAVMGTAMP
ncbi:MAG: hypothetical protein K2X81_08390, partial [Candidatus Obscuribacterales bacterium]|nr:hypothetical protein [Candidatus Obscuribacterales bacterium]